MIFDLKLFDGNTNVTTDDGLSNEMKTYYSDYLIDMAEPKLVHDQFGQKQAIPEGGGKIIEFRKFDSLGKALVPLSEGVTPNGQKMNLSVVTAEVRQYGGFIELSDLLLLTAIDNNLVQATKLLGGQAGRTLDTITREVLSGGTNVQYAEGQITSRGGLYYTSATDHCCLTVRGVKMAVRTLKKFNGEPVGDSYIGIVHPDCAFDLTEDNDWKYPHQYADPEALYQGEIGKIAGVRFVETTEAKKFVAPTLYSDTQRNLTVSAYLLLESAATATEGTGTLYRLTVSETLTEAMAEALVGRKIFIKDVSASTYETAEISGCAYASKYLYLKAAPTATLASGDLVYPGEAGRDGRDVYATLILADNAYGVTEVSGGGLQHIVKQLGSAGTADPLNQRATAGWKATRAAERLVEQYLVRLETVSTFTDYEAN